MNCKSKTCFRRDGKPLAEYYSEREAQENADYVNTSYGRDMIPYQCEKCDLWHLAPESRHTPSERCEECKKQFYDSEESAQKRADIICLEDGVILRIYECHHYKGWHLTKNL